MVTYVLELIDATPGFIDLPSPLVFNLPDDSLMLGDNLVDFAILEFDLVVIAGLARVPPWFRGHG